MVESLELRERIKIAIQVGESQFREFKSCWDGPPNKKSLRPIRDVMADIGKTLVAFANADGGELLIGVEDDGAISGAQYSHDELILLMDAYKTHIHRDTPLPTPRQAIVELDGR